MNDLVFYLAIGGAILITLAYGFYFMRKYPRTTPRIGPRVDPHLYSVAMRTWETGKTQIGTVDEAGNLTIREVEPSNDLKG